VWGYSISDYHSLCRQALNSSTEGWVSDAGCGALASTAKTYANYTRCQKFFPPPLALNLLHVLEDVPGVLRALRKILLDEGTMSFTTLIEANRLADRYLHRWAQAGELVPRTAPQLPAAFEALRLPVTYRIRSNMAFIAYV
jgi:hypothetical protein